MQMHLSIFRRVKWCLFLHIRAVPDNAIYFDSGERPHAVPRRLILLTFAGLGLAVGYWLRFYAPVPAYVSDASGGVAYVLFWILLFAAALPKRSPGLISWWVLVVTC